MLDLAFRLLLLAPSCLGDDSLVLKSGRRIGGHCQSADDTGLLFVDQRGRELPLTWSQVRHLEKDGEAPDLFSAIAPPPPEGGYPGAGGYVGYRPPQDGEPGALTTGVSRWHHPGTDTTMFLIGAVHIGEAAYFRRLQRRLDQMDLVLYEGVKPGDSAGELSPEDLRRLDTLTQLQLTLNRLLMLRFQKDGLNYNRNFWVNSDVNMTELQAELDRQGATLPTDTPLFRILLKLIAGPLDIAAASPDPALSKRLRRQMAPVLANVEKYSSLPQMRGFMNVVLHFRNQRVMRDLDLQLKSETGGRRLAIFYGSAHLPDFEVRLKETDWTYLGCTFIDAWVVH